MQEKLLTNAELNAEKAENYPKFSGIKLLHIKNQVTQILDLIGRNEIFDQYTKHNISHIDQMLKMLDWLIPKETSVLLSPADWLMIVLSIYFHDLGMLVTKDEFNNRDKSDFPNYKKEVFADKFGLDYRQKVFGLGDNAERFLYQEFVRSKHAERIKIWILGEYDVTIGNCDKVIIEINNLINNLDSMFRRDLATICESHHSDKLDDFAIFKTCARYGESSEEYVNLHYAAIILRSADLLHITSDRTPTIEYNLINPTDPISQDEWCKQMAVRAVSPKTKTDKDGNLDENIPKDTIEVTAYFDKPNKANGFFGLISYLSYARNQLQKNYEWNQKAIKAQSSKYNFPWNEIDDSNIETQGFERKLFEFKLDQGKILKLLVGHTLYNDPTVVLRELIQNSIDAVRLQNFVDKQKIGEINIKWDSENRKLSFLDSGTGMNNQVIEKHLLKVGSSRYQDDDFKKEYPDFSPISRFGIGILTCFLIADDIDITTCSIDEEKAKQLSIRKVDGKYLLQHLCKNELPIEIMQHGTIISLYVRQDIDMTKLESNIKKWILYPPCNVWLSIDENTPKKIGYNSPKEALSDYLIEKGFNFDNELIKVEEEKLDGVTLAYAIKFSVYFKEWSFLEIRRKNSVEEFSPIGVCVEGVRIEFDTPGFKGSKIFATANTSGMKAPKTNVARSNFEATDEKNLLLSYIYKIYINHVKNEISNIHKKNGFSLTWASSETLYLLNPLLNSYWKDNRDRFEPLDHQLLNDAINEIPSILIEKGKSRVALSPKEIQNEDIVWTIDCDLLRSAESLIKEIPTNTSLTDLMDILYSSSEHKLYELNCILCGYNPNNVLHNNALLNKQVSSIKVYNKERRVDLKWTNINDESLWRSFSVPAEQNFRNEDVKILLQIGKVDIDVITDEIAIKANGVIYLLGNSELNNYYVKVTEALYNSENRDDKLVLAMLLVIVEKFLDNNVNKKDDIEGTVQRIIKERLNSPMEFIEDTFWGMINKEEFISVFQNTKWKIFDTGVWSRKYIQY